MVQTIEHQTEMNGGPSLGMFLATCAAITLVAAGAGFTASATLLAPAAITMENAGASNTSAGKSAAKPGTGHGAKENAAAASTGPQPVVGEAPGEAVKLSVVDIPSITTNLEDPADAWIRMELSLVFEGPPDKIMAEDVHQDILAYVHTMKLYNLRGGSGYQHLIEDLQDRAAIRTEGRVKRVLVRSLILE